MTRRGITSAVAVSAVLLAGVITGCGSSDPATTATSGSGGPSQAQPASAGAERIDSAVQDVLSNYPSTPICNPGGLPIEDEETCQHFWNYMLAWQPLTDAEGGPTLAGAGAGSMIYGGFEGLFPDAGGGRSSHWWGPDICGGNPRGNTTHCKGARPGLLFGKRALVETEDNGDAVKSRVTWALAPGDVTFGNEYFLAYNNGGAGGDQYAFCSTRSGHTSGQWVSCSRTSDDGAQINTAQPAGNNEDYASYGWVLEDYPILIGIRNGISGSTFVVNARPSTAGVAFSTNASTPGITTGNASLKGSSAASSPGLWLAGFRTRTGNGVVSVTGKLMADKPENAGYNGASVVLKADFSQASGETAGARSCKVLAHAALGDQAKCSIVEWVPGGRSAPGVFRVEIQTGS